MTIEKFVDAMTSRDYVALAACFDRFSRFIDYCPSMTGRQDVHLYCANASEMYFHNKFMFRGFAMKSPEIIDANTVKFFADSNGIVVQAKADIDAFAEAGPEGERLIRELVIRPA